MVVLEVVVVVPLVLDANPLVFLVGMRILGFAVKGASVVVAFVVVVVVVVVLGSSATSSSLSYSSDASS